MKANIEKDAIPDGWQRVRLGDVAEVVMGQSPPGELIIDWQGEALDVDGLPFIQGNAEFGTKYPAPLKWCLQPYKVGVPDDILISVRAPVGETNRVSTQLGIGRGLAAVRFKRESQYFGWHVVNHAKAALDRVTQGSTFAAIGGGELRNLPILLPPLPEQRAIAAVLDSIDDAIEGAKAVISATEGLRDALLHDLLARGLPGQHTEFRDVPGLGTIPADWEVVRLGDVVPKFEYGTSIKCSSEPAGMPILRIPNIASGSLNLSDLKYARLRPKESASIQLATGDILLVRTNGNPDICGQCWVSGGLEGQWGFASYLVRGRADRSVINPWFIGHFLKSDVGRRLLKGNIRTSAGNYNLSVGNLGAMPLPCPQLNEQDSIVNTVQSLSGAIEVAREEAAGLRLMKESTADALLTGRVRVER